MTPHNLPLWNYDTALQIRGTWLETGWQRPRRNMNKALKPRRIGRRFQFGQAVCVVPPPSGRTPKIGPSGRRPTFPNEKITKLDRALNNIQENVLHQSHNVPSVQTMPNRWQVNPKGHKAQQSEPTISCEQEKLDEIFVSCWIEPWQWTCLVGESELS